MGALTSINIERQIAIVVDGMVQSAPTIMEKFSGSFQITGHFSESEAEELALAFNSGSIPTSIKYKVKQLKVE